LFSTPKPERLLQRIFQLSTKPGDWVLDSFAGSGTTGAVAHKMGRRWIMVESGEHCHTHTIPRLKKVIDGADPGGVTKTVGWKGGGGFRYCVLGEPLLTKDPDLGVIVNPNYENGRLVEAVCKFEGFKLNNDETFHGVDGKRFAHITEDQVTQEYLDALTEQLGENESLYIYCTRRAMRLNTPDNVRIKRMPKDLLKDRPDLFKHGQS
jgi:adenine-specific DNA-methyltransferase